MAEVGVADFERVMELSFRTLMDAADRDWSVEAGTLTWTCSQTLSHMADVLFSYAFQVAADPPQGGLPFHELQAYKDADSRMLVYGLKGTGVMMAAVLRAAPPDAQIRWHSDRRSIREWAAMGAREVLLHTYDVMSGLDLPLDAPPDVAAALLVDEAGAEAADDPWAALVRASGRPYGADELASWRAERDARRSRTAPAGSEDGLISDFEDGTASAAFGSGWRVSTDSAVGGTSAAEVSVIDGGADGTSKSLEVTGEVMASDAPLQWAGVIFRPALERGETANLSSKRRLRFWARGDGGTYALWSTTPSGLGGREEFEAGETWRAYDVPFTHIGTDGSDLTGLLFAADIRARPFRFQLDEVRLD